MAKIEKYGNLYRTRVSYLVGGKRKQKAISGETVREVKAKVYEFEREIAALRGARCELLLRIAAERFVSTMEGVYSPTSIRADKKILRLYIAESGIGDIPITMLTQSDVQAWVSRLAERGLSRKTIKNAYSLITRTLDANGIARSFRIKFPPAKKFSPHTPTIEEITALLDYTRETDPPLFVAIALSATTTMRRGEICALTAEDVTDGGITVSKSMKREASGGAWVIAAPKTETSNRTVKTAPQWLIDALPKQGRIVPFNPDQLTTRFERAVKAAGITPFRFQDLRAFAASYMIGIGVSPVTVKNAGGWSNFETPNRHYLRSIAELEEKQTAAAREAFSNLVTI